MAIKLSDYLAKKNLILAGKIINLSKLEAILAAATNPDSPLYADLIQAPGKNKISYEGRGQKMQIVPTGKNKIPDYIIFDEAAFEANLLSSPDLLIKREISEDDLMSMSKEERKSYLQSMTVPVVRIPKTSSKPRAKPEKALFVRQLTSSGKTLVEARAEADKKFPKKSPEISAAKAPSKRGRPKSST